MPLGGCGLREQRGGEKLGDFPHSLSVWSFLSCSPSHSRRASPGSLSVSSPCLLAVYWVRTWGKLEENVMVNSRAVWCYFEFWSFPNLPPPIYFAGLKELLQAVFPGFLVHVPWERQGGACSLQLLQNRKLCVCF